MTSRIFQEGLLANQVAIVTGGGTGIGLAIARELLDVGAVVVLASRKPEHLEPAREWLVARHPGRVFTEIVDIRDRARVEEVVDRVVASRGRLDLLVNCGGGQFFAPAATITPKGFEAVVSTNLLGTWWMTSAAARAWMLEHGGKIVNVTMLTSRGFAGMAHSVAARSGVEGMTRTLAVEWAPFDIRLNCVAPGYIASTGFRNYPDGERWAKEMLAPQVPLKRLGRSEEIAWQVVFLASPAGDYVTGQVLTVDGGRSLWGDHWPIPDRVPMPDVPIETLPWEEED
jgi:NAD(P)-dependent dehydrogenase (short-subunit alcohol dehydrogenase family)